MATDRLKSCSLKLMVRWLNTTLFAHESRQNLCQDFHFRFRADIAFDVQTHGDVVRLYTMPTELQSV